MAHNSYTMCIHGLPDMYTLSPQACGPRALGVHIKQTTHAHGITITYIYIVHSPTLKLAYKFRNILLVIIITTYIPYLLASYASSRLYMYIFRTPIMLVFCLKDIYRISNPTMEEIVTTNPKYQPL